MARAPYIARLDGLKNKKVPDSEHADVGYPVPTESLPQYKRDRFGGNSSRGVGVVVYGKMALRKSLPDTNFGSSDGRTPKVRLRTVVLGRSGDRITVVAATGDC